jgi:hypothetical protein
VANPSDEDVMQEPDPRGYFSEGDPDMTLDVSFETAVFMANSMPKEDEVTKAFKRLIRAKYAAALGLDP